MDKDDPFVPDFQFPINQILGKQAESILLEHFKYSKIYQLLAHNLQIINNGITLGEIDFVVKNRHTQEIIHLELPCKFYLLDPNLEGPPEKQWIGPNRRDSLYQKLIKIRNKQFPLLQLEETQKTFRRLHLPFPDRQQLLLSTFLFVPPNFDAANLSIEYQENILGHYISIVDFLEMEKEGIFALPMKREWLLPISEIKVWYSPQEIIEQIQGLIRQKISPLIYNKTKIGIKRFFVVWW